MTIEYSARAAAHPVLPAASAYALPEDVAQLASNESPDPPLPAVVEAIERVLRRAQPLSRPDERRAARARCRTATACRPSASRSATARATCCSRSARRCSSPGAELVYAWPSFSRLPAPGGRLRRDRDPRPAERPRRARPRGDARGDHRRHAPGDRLQPEQPDEHRGARRRDRRLRRARAATTSACSLDEAYCEFNTLDDPDTTLAAARPPPEPRSCCAPSARSTGWPGCASGFALCGSSEPVAAVNQVRQPFFCSAPAQAAAIEALRHQDAVAERVERAVLARVEVADGLDRARASPSPSRRRTSAGSTLPARAGRGPGGARARTSSPGCASAACSCARARRSAARARLRVTYGTPAENARFLAALRRRRSTPVRRRSVSRVRARRRRVVQCLRR